MSEPDTPGPDPQRLALAWRVAPFSVDFILDIREISRRDRDLIDSLLFATIMSANIAPLNRDTRLQLAYAAAGDPAPDEMRRPVSINAVAQSMRIPFETARRRIRKMERVGALEVTPRGVIIPQTVINDPDFMQGVLLRHERVGRFYQDMRALGALADGPPPSPVSHPAPPVRITNRVCWEYVLRMADELISLTGDPLSGLMLLEILRRNTAGFGPAQWAAWAEAPARVGQPVRTTLFANTLRLSPETARRYVMALEAGGFCARSSKGAIAVLPDVHRPALEQIALDNLANVQRMFARLGQLGALDAWTPTPAARPASFGASS